VTKSDRITWECWCRRAYSLKRQELGRTLLTVAETEEVRSALQLELERFKASRAARSGNSRQTNKKTYQSVGSGQR
jgi:uncharacterized small protein (DUF1192 family)